MAKDNFGEGLVVYREEVYQLRSVQKIGHDVPSPILGLTVTGKPSDTIQIIAECDNRRFFFTTPILIADLAQPYSRQQAVA